MPRKDKCCNPCQIQGHGSKMLITRKLTPLMLGMISRSANAYPTLLASTGQICMHCIERLQKEPTQREISSSSSSSALSSSPEKLEKRLHNEYTRDRLNDMLVDAQKSPMTTRVMRSKDGRKRKRNEIINLVDEVISLDQNDDGEEMIEQLKSKMRTATTSDEKYLILTALPKSWSVRKVAREMGVSRSLARRSKNLVENRGILSTPAQKLGSNSLDASTVDLIQSFYRDDEHSQACPGKRDYVTINENGHQIKKQRRMLMCNLKEVYLYFKEKYPNYKIGFSTFAGLRPKEVVLGLDKHGTHSVCVCAHHQNVKLILEPMKRVHILDSSTDIRKILMQLMCENATEKCHWNECEECTGFDALRISWESRFSSQCIEKVKFNQWMNIGTSK